MEIDRILTKTELEKLKSTKGIIELICNIDNVDLDNLEELDYQTRDLIEDTLKINLLSYSQFEGNLRRSMASHNLAIINRKQLTALALLYFGKKDETTGKYTHYICPYTGTRYELKNLQSELRKKYNDRDKTKILELEHIMPHSSNGGTILPNIIPISKIANNQKNDMHILDYFKSTGQKDYQNNGPKRLYNLVNYILSAYEIAFSQYNESEIDYLYDYDTKDEDGIDEEDLENERKKLNQQQKQKKLNETPIEGYIPYIKQLTKELQRNGYNIEPINNKIKELEEKGIFKDLDKYDLVQETIENLFKENLSSDNKKTYLSYTTKIDYVKLVNSINTNDLEQIKQIIINRFNNIKYLVNYSQKTMKDYFISMKDMNEEDILYIDVDISNLEDPNIIAFITSLKLGLETKINIFIDMLSDEDRIYTSYENGIKNNIFNSRNKISFKGYENIEGLNTNYFWDDNSDKIEKMLEILENNPNNTEEEKAKYQRARRAIEEYKFQCKRTGFNLRIECFIDMLSDENRIYTSYENGEPNESNIFKGIQNNPIPFKGYESIEGLNTNRFWSSNSNKIKETLEKLENNPDNTEQDKAKYQRARRAIEEYEFQCQDTGLNLRIECFIDMLSDENRIYTSYENGEPNESNIFKVIQNNPIPFKGYESIEGLNTNGFWKKNSDKIEKMLEILENNPDNTEEEKAKYQRARRAIKEYRFVNSLEERIKVYIDMLSDENRIYTSYENGFPNKNNIFKEIQNNPILFKGYESIEGLNTNQFWNGNLDKIEKMLEILENNPDNTEEEKAKYQRARRAIKEYRFVSSLEERIKVYIDMLSDENRIYTSYENGFPNKNNIFKGIQNNPIPFKGYENIEGLNTNYFWNNNSDKIEKMLKKLENNPENTDEDKVKYQRARRAIEEYKFQCDSEINLRIECFIDMLTDEQYTSYELTKTNKRKVNQNNIFKKEQEKPIPFKGYENIEGLNTNYFWNNNSPRIISLLFYNKQYDADKKCYIDSEKDYSIKQYDAARNAVLEYLSITDKTTYTNIEQYIDKLEQKEKKTKKVLELIDLRNNLKKILDNLELEESLLIEENKQLINEYIEKQQDTETRRVI